MTERLEQRGQLACASRVAQGCRDVPTRRLAALGGEAVRWVLDDEQPVIRTVWRDPTVGGS